MVVRRKPVGLSWYPLLLLILMMGTITPVRAQQNLYVHLQPAGVQEDEVLAASGSITVASPWEGQALYLPPGQSIAVFITGNATVSDGAIAVKLSIDNEASTRNAEVDATGTWSYQWSVPSGMALGPHKVKAILNDGLASVERHFSFIGTPPGDIALTSPSPGTTYHVPSRGSINISVTGNATSNTPITVNMYLDGDPTPHPCSVAANGSWSYTWTVGQSTRLGIRTIRAVLNNGEAYVEVTVRLDRTQYIPLVKR